MCWRPVLGPYCLSLGTDECAQGDECALVASCPFCDPLAQLLPRLWSRGSLSAWLVLKESSCAACRSGAQTFSNSSREVGRQQRDATEHQGSIFLLFEFVQLSGCACTGAKCCRCIGKDLDEG